MSDNRTPPTSPVSPRGFNHLVLHVRDLDESHRFWCDMLGFHQVGELKVGPDQPNPSKMRFYSGVTNDTVNHHDLALLEVPGLPMAPTWSVKGNHCAINHMAITYPDRESWMAQVRYLDSQGALTNPLRMDHGMTHSVYTVDPNGYGVEVCYDLPAEVWENDIDAALQYAEQLPDDHLFEDNTDYRVFG